MFTGCFFKCIGIQVKLRFLPVSSQIASNNKQALKAYCTSTHSTYYIKKGTPFYTYNNSNVSNVLYFELLSKYHPATMFLYKKTWQNMDWYDNI
jgi:hypothetical protein